MTTAARHAYVHGRISGMAKNLLSRAELGAMFTLPINKKQELLSRVGLPEIHRGQVGRTPPSLEQRFIASLLADLGVLLRAVSGNAHRFFMYWSYRFDLSNLKTILRGKLIGLPSTVVRSYLIEMGPLAKLPIEDLLRTEDVTELLWQLDGTPFRDIALHARRIYEERHDLFALDAAVDRHYFAKLSSLASQVTGGAGGALHVLVGDLVDRQNILWLLRYRFTYGLAPADTYYLLIPASYMISRNDLAKLSQLGSFADTITQLPTPYNRLLSGATDIAEVTRRLEVYAWRRAEAILHGSAFNDGRTFAYLILRERDLFRVRAIVTGKSLNIDLDLTRMAASSED